MYRAMLLVALLFSMAFSSSAEVDDFYEKYTYAKTMSVCFGGSAYEEYLLLIANAKRECSGTSTYSASPKQDQGYNDYNPSYNNQQPGYETRRPFSTGSDYDPSYNNRQPDYTTRRPFLTGSSNYGPSYNNRQPDYTTRRPFFTVTSAPINVVKGGITAKPGTYYPSYGRQHTFMNFLSGNDNKAKSQYNQNQNKLYDSVAINMAVEEISNALRNFTCVLGTLQLIDQSLNINYDMMVNNYFKSQLDGQLQADLISGINYCKALVSCIPEDKSPISYELQRLMAFVKCEKKTRLSACFKQDLRNNLHHFDISALPDDGMKTTDLEKLMTILIGSESLDQLELY